MTAAILVHNDRILIAQRRDPDNLAGKWEFPGGKIEHNETPQQCLIREMKEEFDIDVVIGEFFDESIYHYEIRNSSAAGVSHDLEARTLFFECSCRHTVGIIESDARDMNLHRPIYPLQKNCSNARYPVICYPLS